MKALIIDEPWMSEVLAGREISEMRRTACRRGGRIALIRKGGGQVVRTAEVVKSAAERIIEGFGAMMATGRRGAIS